VHVAFNVGNWSVNEEGCEHISYERVSKPIVLPCFALRDLFAFRFCYVVMPHSYCVVCPSATSPDISIDPELASFPSGPKRADDRLGLSASLTRTDCPLSDLVPRRSRQLPTRDRGVIRIERFFPAGQGPPPLRPLFVLTGWSAAPEALAFGLTFASLRSLVPPAH
jgi:hypothetical protein